MKSTDKYLLVLVASLALLLAGCGGGSSSTPTTPTTPVDPGPTPSDQLATANKIIMLHEEASGATVDAEAAGMAAAQAVKDATKYSGMLTTAKVKGDSTKAMMNAQMVLDARAAVTQAVMDAEAAKMRATDAKSMAEALADGTNGKPEVIMALDAAIKAAEAELVTVTAISTGSNADYTNNDDGQALMMAVEEVTGTAAKLKTPDDIAETVAMAVAGALVPTVTEAPGATADGTATRVNHFKNLGAVFAFGAPNEYDFRVDNSLGRTWAEIVGEDNIMMERIGSGNRAEPVASIAGMDASALDKTSTPVLTSTGGDGEGKYSDGVQVGTSTNPASGILGTEYKGIPVEVWCLGGSAGCSVNADGKLSDGWYFTPRNLTAHYILNPDVDERDTKLYVADENRIDYGYWLAVTNNNVVTLNTFASPSIGNPNTTFNLAEDNTAGAVNTATYTGEAAGMSVHKTFDGNGKQLGIHSGAFTADVSLTATFGTTATLSGTVDNFQGGANTDSGWSVALQERNLTNTAALVGDALSGGTPNTLTGGGVAKGSGQAGDWSAQGYGSVTTARPVGFFGNFEAHFTDGHASGAYATRKD